MSTQDRDESVIHYYRDIKLSMREVANRHGISHETVRNILAKHRVKIREAEGTRHLNINIRPPTMEWYERLEKYCDEHHVVRRQLVINAVTEYLDRREVTAVEVSPADTSTQSVAMYPSPLGGPPFRT